MGKHGRSVVGFAVFLGFGLAAAQARAQCCPGYTLATACSGVTLTKSRWCIQNTVPTGQSALPEVFCSYGDKVISTLEMVFNIQAPSTFEFELDTQTGGAHTGTACNGFGNGTAYDAFSGNAYGANYFWGYLLSLHEAINDWTGMASGGWPTDWWADHQSAFPNLMDFHVMNTIGVSENDANLIQVATAQKARFYPKGDSSDPKVVALDNVFAAMPNMDGFAGFSHLFALVSGDGLSWDGLGVPNPDVKRSEYVAAYMSLAAEQPVLKLLQGPGANGGGNICNDTPDGITGDAPYTCSEAHIDTIATAHCSIAANGKPHADLTALQSGNYTNIPSGPCGSACPSECACEAATNHCVPPWLSGVSVSDGGGGSGGNEAGGGSGSTRGSTSGTGGGGTPNGGAGSSGAAGAGSANGASGSTFGVGAATGVSSGDTSAGSADTGSTMSASGTEPMSAAGGSGVAAATSGPPAPPKTGCSCRTVGAAPARSGLASFFAFALVAGALVRGRFRRR
jgi:hypothetical protein